jgi:hypothetical protein
MEKGGCVSCVRRYRLIVQEPTSAISQGNRYVVRELQTEHSEYQIAVIDRFSRFPVFAGGRDKGFGTGPLL